MDRAQRLIELANFRLARWSDRRKHEWAVSAVLWIALAGGAASGKISITTSAQKVPLAMMLFVLVLGHAILWVRFNFARNQHDLKAAFQYIAQAHEDLLINSAPASPDSQTQIWVKNRFPGFEFIVQPPCLFQILISILVAGFFFLVVAGC